MATVEIVRLVGDGQGLGYIDGKAVFVAGALPGETVECDVVNERTSSVTGRLTRITKASEHRSGAAEDHYLVCSPWQNVDYAYQLSCKQAMLGEIWARPGLELAAPEVVASPQPTHYRNKLEFAVLRRGEAWTLALHDRDSRTDLAPAPDGCVLGHEALSEAARGALEALTRQGVQSAVQSIAVRQATLPAGVVIVVQLHTRVRADWQALITKGISGVVITAVKGKTTEIVRSFGQGELSQRLLGSDYTYGAADFFQVNPAAFELALADILQVVPSGSRVLDLYGGVGVIGLAACEQATSVTSIELVASSVERARANAQAAGRTNYTAQVADGGRLDDALTRGYDVVIVDPPRAGLAAPLVQQLQAAAPQRTIYLSCNPVTQARDVLLLIESGYTITQTAAYDFYPGTLHVESLLVLDRK